MVFTKVLVLRWNMSKSLDIIFLAKKKESVVVVVWHTAIETKLNVAYGSTTFGDYFQHIVVALVVDL